MRMYQNMPLIESGKKRAVDGQATKNPRQDTQSRNVMLPQLDAKHGTQTTHYNSISTQSGCPELQPVIDLQAKVAAFEKNRNSILNFVNHDQKFITPNPSIGAIQTNQDNILVRAGNLSSYDSYNPHADPVDKKSGHKSILKKNSSLSLSNQFNGMMNRRFANARVQMQYLDQIHSASVELLQGQKTFKIPQLQTQKTKQRRGPEISHQVSPNNQMIQFDLEASTHESLFSSEHKGTQRSKTSSKLKERRSVPDGSNSVQEQPGLLQSVNRGSLAGLQNFTQGTERSQKRVSPMRFARNKAGLVSADSDVQIYIEQQAGNHESYRDF